MAPSCRPQNGAVRAVAIEELDHLPFVRHQVDPTRVEGAWVAGEAAAVVVRRTLAAGEVRVASAFGTPADLRPLLAAVADCTPPPDRLLLDAPDATPVPDRWRLAEVRRWHWMLTTRVPDPVDVEVEEVPEEAEVDALLDLAAPDSHARPGTPGIEAWLGVRDEARALVAVGAVVRQPDGSGHLRAVTVHPRARVRGLGRALSTTMTRRAMAGSGVASLGVYVDNEPALRIYRGLGYAPVHTFVSGPVSDSSITSAADPSR